MQLLRTRRPSRQRISAANLSRSRRIEPPATDEPSRHDAQLLSSRSVPTDPYTVWLEEREAERRASSIHRSDSQVGVWR
jgi:hypothetical protein